MHMRNRKKRSVQCDPSRRGFLKVCGAAAAGGASLALVPEALAGIGRETPDYRMLVHDSTISEELYWWRLRSQFVLPRDLIYMNTGTEGSMPRFVLNNLRKDLCDFAAQPMDTVLNDERCCMFMFQVRPRVASFLGCDADEIVMTTNTTEGLGWIINGLDLGAGDGVVTTVHFQPYNAALYFLRDRRGISVNEIDLPTPATSKQEIVDAFEAAITPDTKLFCFCHINYATGLRMPVKEICALARSHGIITLVDGAHAIGHLDLDLHDLAPDFYATSPHKWLCAPPGTGVLYMRQEMQARVYPVVTEQYLLSPSASIEAGYFQMRGQQCTPAYAGVMDVMDFQDGIGTERIEQRILTLSAYAKERIIETWGEDVLVSPAPEYTDLETGLVAFNPFAQKYGGYGDDIAALFYGLWDEDIITRSVGFTMHPGDSQNYRILRFSTHIYNNFNHIDRAIEAVQKIILTL